MAAKGAKIDLIGREAAYLSALEIGLGSVLHALHVPFTGYFLSLNQGFFLSRAVSEARARGLERPRTVPLSISTIAALLKSLSPAGKKLTPMLAISMQGVFYSAGTLTLGPTLPGAVLGSLLASFWAFLQPLILYSILYGRTLVQIAEYYQGKFGFVRILLALVAVKAVLSMALALAGYLLSQRRFEAYRQRLLQAARRRAAVLTEKPDADGAPVTAAHAARGALKDLTRPFFLFSLALTGFFFFAAEASFATLFWQLMRPVAVGFVIFFAVRLIPLQRVSSWLEGSRFKSTGRGLRTAVETLRDL